MDFAKFCEQMQLIIRNPDPEPDIRTFKSWEKGGTTTRGAWRSFLKHNGWTGPDWAHIRDDTMFEWYLNTLGYYRYDKDEEVSDGPKEPVCEQVEGE